jgi:hypothetical protein
MFRNPQSFFSEWKDLKAVLRMLRYRVFVENPKIRNILMGIQKSLPLSFSDTNIGSLLVR